MQIFSNTSNTVFFLDCVKLIGYLASAVTVVSDNLYVGPSPKTKMFFFCYQRTQMSSYHHQK